MKRIISCDWGTSTLRLRVIDPSNTSVLAEIVSDQGILKTFDLWKVSGNPKEARLSFYQSVLAVAIRSLEKQLLTSLALDPIVISGMASSSIGMMELPYREMPIAIDGTDLEIRFIDRNDSFKHEIYLISGARSGNDIMRGEETQLIGCIHGDVKGEHLFIFPGTHSKHITVRDNQAIDVKTFMTGEFFELLRQHSILSNDIGQAGDVITNDQRELFKKAVKESFHTNILHTSFSIRVNSILRNSVKEENYYYLSGLLIGTELKELADRKKLLSIVGNKTLVELYRTALQELGMDTIQSFDASLAAIRGHCRIYNLHKGGKTDYSS